MSSGDEKPEAFEAAALKYDPEEVGAPVMVALGRGPTAERIVETAKDSGIQVVKDDKLSHMLQKMSVGDEIPEELYKVVAEVLVFVSSMDEKRSRRFGLANKR